MPERLSTGGQYLVPRSLVPPDLLAGAPARVVVRVAPGTDPEIPVQMPAGVPIYLTYITAQPTDGQIAWTKDVYGWDKPGAQIASSYVSPVAAAR